MGIPENNSNLSITTVTPAFGVLYLVAVPIGNDDDISKRAIEVLKKADLVLCEEYKEAKRILRSIETDKPLLALNEHTEQGEAANVISMLQSGKNIALISDHGTPLLEDPGKLIVRNAIKNGIKITTVPGASSIISALILSGFDAKKFIYYGLLSPRKDERKKELNKLKNVEYTIILLDTPYRMINLIESIIEVMGSDREISLSIDLTMESEKIFRGKISDVLSEIKKLGIKKSEFVLVLNGKKDDRSFSKQNHKFIRH